jgi:hypothetical protein
MSACRRQRPIVRLARRGQHVVALRAAEVQPVAVQCPSLRDLPKAIVEIPAVRGMPSETSESWPLHTRASVLRKLALGLCHRVELAVLGFEPLHWPDSGQPTNGHAGLTEKSPQTRRKTWTPGMAASGADPLFALSPTPCVARCLPAMGA